MNGPINEEPARPAQGGPTHGPDDGDRLRGREANRHYGGSHSEQSAATQRRWVEANRDPVRETDHHWRKEHLDRDRQLDRESVHWAFMRTQRVADQRQRARERAARWRAGHLDEVRDYQVQWVERNRDKVRGYYNHYYRTHRDEVNARAAARRDADPERMKQARKDWAERNKERLADLQRNRRDDPVIYQAQLESNAAARRLKRRLAGAGLPPKRLHPATAAERRMHARESAAYFDNPNLFEHVRQRTVLTESLTNHMLANGAEMRTFAESYVTTRARVGLPPRAVDDMMYARAVEYVVDHLDDIEFLTSRDVASAVRSSKAIVQRAERDRQFGRLLKTLIAHLDDHRSRLDEEAEIENRARAQRGLPRVTAGALLARLAVEEVVESVPTDQLQREDLRSAMRKAQFHIVTGTCCNADDTRALSSRSHFGQHDPIRVR